MQHSGAVLSPSVCRFDLDLDSFYSTPSNTSFEFALRWSPTERMAEIFAAVASGAGLVSLAIQLLESSQKLKSLYDTIKDAPETIRNLCFELETLSLQLRQLERHRQNDALETELLDRCIATCELRTRKVEAVVNEMARYMQKSKVVGRIYNTFKDSEMRRLLEDLEQAKSALSLAYITYCQCVHLSPQVYTPSNDE